MLRRLSKTTKTQERVKKNSIFWQFHAVLSQIDVLRMNHPKTMSSNVQIFFHGENSNNIDNGIYHKCK